MADRNRDLDEEEASFTEAVAQALTETADEFAAAVRDADELVAARFSVGRITRMWGARVTGLVRRLLGTAERAAEAAAEDAGTDLPAGWDDLPGRYDEGRLLPSAIDQYVTTTEQLLRAVGDRLAEAARAELAAGVDAGEDLDQLRDRLRAAFTRDGAQLGPVRENRIARTEATRAWNTSTLAAARAVTGPGRPVVKQWVTRHDTRVRTAHDAVDGQIRLLAEPFTVAGVAMQAPGDPTAPPGLVINCRCRLAVAPEIRAAAYEAKDPARTRALESEETGVEAPEPLTAAAGGYTGAMIALLPSAEDAERLALAADGAEPAEQLHLTLFYLGKGADWDEEQRAELIANLRSHVAMAGLGQPLAARAFGANQWNADGDDPCWVWAVGDDSTADRNAPRLENARWLAVDALESMHSQPDLPAQHSPWAGHICAVYTGETWPLEELNARLGPITFDRLRVAFAGDHTDIPLNWEEEEPLMDEAENATTDLAARPWSTPDDTALAFENTETGDGRVFRPGSLYWEGPGPWALQHADEMLVGHEGAELAGAIQHLERDGDRITGTGVIYPGRPAGADALMLLEQGAPLGVSVDLDDVSLEFVDRTGGADEEGEIMLLASLSSASVLRLNDGSWMLTATSMADWTASGAVLSRTASSAQLLTGEGGRVTAAAVHAALGGTGRLTAAAGDPDDQELGTVVHSESSGDLLMRITRARLRGATLVAMPAYDRARIVLDTMPEAEEDWDPEEEWAAAGPSPAQVRVIGFVQSAPVPVGAREVGRALRMRMETARGHLARAVQAGRLVRLARGVYVGLGGRPEQFTASTSDDDAATRQGDEELVASAWTAMKDLPPMPAAWFAEPTRDELPPGSGGVHYKDGRVYGWVAKAGEPHAGYPGKNLTIESLGKLDLTHFLRAKFSLDDGSTVRAGAFTMNVPHHQDGAECNTAACQFDDSRTVAAIVTVGMNSRGLWFSGAAAPWLSEWDRRVFRGCQPSYHLNHAGGRWQLRAVLTVPVPGHSSALIATAVTERSNMALAASAAGLLPAPDTSGHAQDNGPGIPDNPADTTSATAPDLGGHHPDVIPDNPVAASGRKSASSREVDAVARELVASVPFLDVLLHAMERRQAQIDTSAQDELARLTASVIAPAREELAATTTQGDS
ncbi:phage minor head protein [Streptomyces sp. NPDC001552]|uniref:phage minor head protein n=1 Tax=Streptomyces sp. NPDC001552 TaxID=3364587 RepID=UPI0036AAE386